VQKSQPQVAFVAAALALLVLPLLVMFGLTALGLAAGLLSPIDRLMNGQVAGVWLAVFVVWVLLVVAAVLMLISRLIRRASRS
jgi:hypothetical protein